VRQVNQESSAGNYVAGTSIAHGHAETVHRVFTALNAHDFPALAKLLHADVAWYIAGRSAVAGEAVGRDAVFARFAHYIRDSSGSFHVSLKKVLHSADGRVVAIHHDSGQRNGKRLNAGCCTVFDFEDGLILEGREHFHDLYHWDEFWS
jgi:ketosteroid isomerase-like protein